SITLSRHNVSHDTLHIHCSSPCSTIRLLYSLSPVVSYQHVLSTLSYQHVLHHTNTQYVIFYIVIASNNLNINTHHNHRHSHAHAYYSDPYI
ncbi:unnamed protein product, partial [Amoebophrya sp. A25]